MKGSAAQFPGTPCRSVSQSLRPADSKPIDAQRQAAAAAACEIEFLAAHPITKSSSSPPRRTTAPASASSGPWSTKPSCSASAPIPSSLKPSKPPPAPSTPDNEIPGWTEDEKWNYLNSCGTGMRPERRFRRNRAKSRYDPIFSDAPPVGEYGAPEPCLRTMSAMAAGARDFVSPSCVMASSIGRKWYRCAIRRRQTCMARGEIDTCRRD